jgi:hypothetical protein
MIAGGQVKESTYRLRQNKIKFPPVWTGTDGPLPRALAVCVVKL